MNRDEIINRVAAIVLAIVLWVYVISVVNPPTTVTVRQVPVTLLNQEYLDDSKLAIAGDGKYTVDVDLSGKRKDLILGPSDLSATADLSGLTPGQNYITVRVTSPSNTTVESIRTEKIQVYVDNLVSVAKPVVLDVANVPSDTEFTVLDLSQEQILVSGAKSLVDMVDHLTVHVDAGGLSVDEATEQQYALTPMDAEGNVVKAVKLESPFVSMSSTLYTVKSVPLYTRVDGAPGYGLELLSSSIPSAVSIKGTLLDLAKVNYVDAQPLDITDITTNTELPVVPVLPDGIALAANNGDLIASFTLSDQASMTMEADSSQIVLENLPEGFTAAASGEPFTMQVTVKGPVETISDLTADIFAYYVDLSTIEEAGEYDLPIYTGTTIGESLETVIEPAQLHVLVEALAPEEDE
ncbi:MAG: hypothetical protein II418_07685 [Firmicutes bacterium]|nr:hypothetical protein [Bacillota bacterium]